MSSKNGAALGAHIATAMTEVPCLQCASTARDLGPLPASNLFAGRALDRLLPGGRLYRCRRCHVGFRFPRLPKHELDALYAAGGSGHWDYTHAQRPDWDLARTWIGRHGAAGAVLDVGCFDGAFLASLPGALDKFGIEIMHEPALAAARNGVRIIGQDFAALAQHEGAFDALTAFDVIEHVADPLAFLEAAARSVRPGGALLVSTGNLDAWSWRLMGSRYWYCAIPEHISFLSERWFRGAAATLGLRLRECHRYAHAAAAPGRRLREALTNAVFLAAPSVIGALRRRQARAQPAYLHPDIFASYPPVWQSAADHILAILEKR